MIQLRDYQVDGKRQVYDFFREGHRNVLYKLQTGGGKSVAFADMIKENYDMGNHVVLCVKRRALIEQASLHLVRQGIPHGIYMANHRRFRPKERVQICSIDTLSARSLYPHADKERVFRVVDECHDCTPDSKSYDTFMNAYPQAFTVGFTATPYTDNTYWTAMVEPIQAHEMRDRGYLVPERTFVPNVIDISNVKSNKRKGDYDEKTLFEATSGNAVVGNFVRDWQLYSQQRPTILFAVNVEHSRIITKAFVDAGIPAVHCDAKTKPRERTRAIKGLVSGAIKVLCNVDIFSTGVDIPEAACIQLCRPTQSLVWHIQSIGRGLRIAPHTGKQDCIIIDNAGNTYRHGTPYMPREVVLGGKPRTDTGEEIKIRACKRCMFIFPSHIRQCPECGFQNETVVRTINHQEGELKEYEMSQDEKDAMNRQMLMNDYHKLGHIQKLRGFKDNWKYYQLKKKYGVDLLSTHATIIQCPEFILKE